MIYFKSSLLVIEQLHRNVDMEIKLFKDFCQKVWKIKYGFKLQGNQLILDNYLLTDASNKFRNQEIEINLYLPKGTIFKADEAFRNLDISDDEFFNLHTTDNQWLFQSITKAAIKVIFQKKVR